MAGTIIADYIRADANKLSFNVGNTIIASVNSAGILSNTGNVLINSSGLLEANSVYYNGSAVLSSGRVQRVNQPAGSVLQVVQTVKTDTFSMTGTTYTDVTGMSVSITPTSSSSKILVLVDGVLGHYNYHSKVRLMRNSTAIGLGDVASSRPQATVAMSAYAGTASNDSYHMLPFGISYLDSPSTTSSTTYKIQISGYSASYNVYINRNYQWQSSADYDATPISTITVMEIAQ